MTRHKGTLFMYFADADETARETLAVTGVTVTSQVDPFQAYNPADPTWRASQPDLLSWSARVSFHLSATSGVPDTTQDKLEDLAFSAAEFPVAFEGSDGSYYAGTGFVSSMRLDSSDEQLATTTIVVQGNGPLSPAAQGTTCDAPFFYSELAPSDPPGVTVALGTDPGWVRIAELNSAQGDLYIYYDGVEVAGPIDWTDFDAVYWWYYDPGVSGPYTARFWIDFDGVPFNPSMYIRVNCPTSSS